MQGRKCSFDKVLSGWGQGDAEESLGSRGDGGKETNWSEWRCMEKGKKTGRGRGLGLGDLNDREEEECLLK